MSWLDAIFMILGVLLYLLGYALIDSYAGKPRDLTKLGVAASFIVGTVLIQAGCEL